MFDLSEIGGKPLTTGGGSGGASWGDSSSSGWGGFKFHHQFYYQFFDFGGSGQGESSSFWKYLVLLRFFLFCQSCGLETHVERRSLVLVIIDFLNICILVMVCAMMSLTKVV